MSDDDPQDIPVEYLRAGDWARERIPPLRSGVARPVPAMRPILVSMRSETEYVVIDGHSRLSLLVGFGHRVVPCRVEIGLTPKQEAERYIEVNSRRMPVTATDLAHAKRVAAEGPATSAYIVTVTRDSETWRAVAYDASKPSFRRLGDDIVIAAQAPVDGGCIATGSSSFEAATMALSSAMPESGEMEIRADECPACGVWSKVGEPTHHPDCPCAP